MRRLPAASTLGLILLLGFRAFGEMPMEASMPMEMSLGNMLPHPGFRFYGWLDTGITANFDSPRDHQNFGRLLDDRSNEPLLNQFVLAVERGFDPMADHFDWAFQLQFLYGSDARYLHTIGLLDLTTRDIVQPDLPEAWLLAHIPITGTAGGVDVQVGKFMTCEGADMSDPRVNVFYSRTYIFNFGSPFFGVGALATLHACSCCNVVAAIDRGVNIALEDNNGSPSFYGGITATCCNGRVNAAAMIHAGPEDPNDNRDWRYLGDLLTTWKLTDRLTSITDANYAYDEGFDARGYGVAQYLTNKINNCCTAAVRAEIWRDENGFFVAQFASNNDFVRFERGDVIFDPRTVGGGRTTYGAATVGVTIKPPVPAPLTGLMIIRPELRYDRALNGTQPFNDSSDRDMFTAAVDMVV